MQISYFKELFNLIYSKNKKMESHISKHKKKPISNLKDILPLPPDISMTLAILIRAMYRHINVTCYIHCGDEALYL